MKAYSITDVGMRRELNEDSVFCFSAPIGNLPNLALLADGMGGHNAGEIASAMAIDIVKDSVLRDPGINPITVLNRAIQAANAQLFDRAQSSQEFRGMGTTLVACTVDDGMLRIANVGDSRLYIVGRNTGIRQITRDHSLVEELVAEGKLNRKDALYSEQKNIITRAVGIQKRVMPDFFDVEVSPGETILMCSDGLSNMIDDYRIAQIILGESNLERCAQLLVREANRNGGKDNISVVLISPEE